MNNKAMPTPATAIVCLLATLLLPAHSLAFVLSFDNTDFNVSPQFSAVSEFTFEIDIDAPLQAGTYDNPPIRSLNYAVSGTLVAGTPSGFPSFNLVRAISGEDFYAQGSSLNFSIAANANLQDGLQVDELAGDGLVFTFNGREIDNGRFHPALVELYANGTGQIQNSNNVHTLDPLLEVDFGAEYITALTFDPGNLSLVPGNGGGGGGGSASILGLLALGLALAARRRPFYRRFPKSP